MNLTLSTPIVVLLAGQQVPFGASLAPETGTPFRLWLLAPGLRFHLIVFCDGIEGDCVGSTETYRDSQIVICMSNYHYVHLRSNEFAAAQARFRLFQLQR